MKILHVNYSDAEGGAAIAVKRLHNILNQKQIDSKLLVSEKKNQDKIEDDEAKEEVADEITYKTRAKAIPRGCVACVEPPPALTINRLNKKDLVMRFDDGWQRGRIMGSTTRDGCNFVVRWEGERDGRFQLLKLEQYSSRKDSLYTWCVYGKVSTLFLFLL